MRPAPPADFTAVNPATFYTTGDVAGLFKVNVSTVANWIASGKLPAIPRIGRGHRRVLGSAILLMLGPQAQTLRPRSMTEKEVREAALEDLRAIEAM